MHVGGRGEALPPGSQGADAEGAGRAGPAGQVCRPLGNKSSDVLCLGLALSLGDIAAPLAEDGPRRALFRQFHTDFPLDGAEADADWREVLAAAEELRARAATGEEVRIWADDTPDGACGLRHAAALLAGWTPG